MLGSGDEEGVGSSVGRIHFPRRGVSMTVLVPRLGLR